MATVCSTWLVCLWTTETVGVIVPPGHHPQVTRTTENWWIKRSCWRRRWRRWRGGESEQMDGHWWRARSQPAHLVMACSQAASRSRDANGNSNTTGRGKLKSLMVWMFLNFCVWYIDVSLFLLDDHQLMVRWFIKCFLCYNCGILFSIVLVASAPSSEPDGFLTSPDTYLIFSLSGFLLSSK